MPRYEVRSHGVSYLLESASRDAAMIHVITELLAAQLRVVLPPDLRIEEWDELDHFRNQIDAIASTRSGPRDGD